MEREKERLRGVKNMDSQERRCLTFPFFEGIERVERRGSEKSPTGEIKYRRAQTKYSAGKTGKSDALAFWDSGARSRVAKVSGGQSNCERNNEMIENTKD